MNEIDKDNMERMSELRKKIIETENDNAAKAKKDGGIQAESEGKTTVETNEVGQGGPSGEQETKSAKKQFHDEDNDDDIIIPSANIRNKLIPNCFGVYRP